MRIALALLVVLPACSLTDLSGYTGGDDALGIDTATGFDDSGDDSADAPATTTTPTRMTDTGATDTATPDTHVTDSATVDSGAADTSKPDTATASDTATAADTYKPDTYVADTYTPDTATTPTETGGALDTGGTPQAFTVTYSGTAGVGVTTAAGVVTPAAAKSSLSAGTLTTTAVGTANAGSGSMINMSGWDSADTSTDCSQQTSVYSFTLTAAGKTITPTQLVVTLYRSADGPQNVAFYTSDDTFASAAWSGTLPAASTSYTETLTISGISDPGSLTIEIAACNAIPGSGSNPSGGTLRIMNPLTVTGTIQ